MMAARRLLRPLIAVALVATALLARPAGAEDARAASAALPAGEVSALPPDKDFLAALASELRLSLSSRPGEVILRMPLAPTEWSLSGLRPYAALSPRVLKPTMDSLTGLAAPQRELAQDLSHGLGVGPGFTWHLSNRLDLFGQYLFRATPSTGVPADSPTLRPDTDSSGLKGGFSVRF
jgi:hypothetical protein